MLRAPERYEVNINKSPTDRWDLESMSQNTTIKHYVYNRGFFLDIYRCLLAIYRLSHLAVYIFIRCVYTIL